MVELLKNTSQFQVEKPVAYEALDVVVANQMVSDGCPNRGVELRTGDVLNKRVPNNSTSISEQERYS